MGMWGWAPPPPGHLATHATTVPSGSQSGTQVEAAATSDGERLYVLIRARTPPQHQKAKSAVTKFERCCFTEEHIRALIKG